MWLCWLFLPGSCQKADAAPGRVQLPRLTLLASGGARCPPGRKSLWSHQGPLQPPDAVSSRVTKYQHNCWERETWLFSPLAQILWAFFFSPLSLLSVGLDKVIPYIGTGDMGTSLSSHS